MTDIEIIDKTMEQVTLATGVWFYQHVCEYRKVGMKRTKRVHANAIRHDQCVPHEQNLATLALNVQITNGQRSEFFTDIDDVTDEWKDEFLWFVNMPNGIPRILVGNDHRFIKRKIEFTVRVYIKEIRSGKRDWWSGRIAE